MYLLHSNSAYKLPEKVYVLLKSSHSSVQCVLMKMSGAFFSENLPKLLFLRCFWGKMLLKSYKYLDQPPVWLCSVSLLVIFLKKKYQAKFNITFSSLAEIYFDSSKASGRSNEDISRWIRNTTYFCASLSCIKSFVSQKWIWNIAKQLYRGCDCLDLFLNHVVNQDE